MPKSLYDTRNYPRRSGTSRLQRTNPVLLGQSVAIDERTIPDFIRFAQKFSKYLIYYNANNIPQGDWQSFLYHDITYQLALKAADSSSNWEAGWKELMEQVEGAGGAPPLEEDHKKYFTWRFNFLYTLVVKMLEAYVNGHHLPAWQKDLEALFTTAHLNIIYSLLENYYAASGDLLSQHAGNFSFGENLLFTKEIAVDQIHQFGEPVAGLLQLNEPLVPNGDFIFGTAGSVAEKVSAASEYLDELAAQLIRIYSGVNSLASKYLNATLTDYQVHQPHVGLLYAFLQLADEHRKEINGLLIQHLDFYYKQVLCVKEKTFLSPQAFVSFELVKNISEHFIPAGTYLTAGKDPAQQEVLFKTISDILVNKTELAEIRSFTCIEPPPASSNFKLPRGLFAATVANSVDGKGKPLPPGKSWDAFQVTDSTHELNVQTGISFYAPLLAEAPGEERFFSIQLEYATIVFTDAVIAFLGQYGTICIFTEEDPINIPITGAEPIYNGKGVNISFTISGKTKLSKASPNASIIFGNKLGSVEDSFFDVFNMFQTERLVKLQLLLFNHVVKVTKAETTAGTTDLSSAFSAFGGVPKVGSSFSVIGPLLANRTLTNLSMDIEWSAETERPMDIQISLPGLQGANRVIDKGTAISTINLVNNVPLYCTGEAIKVKLLKDLGHASYANDITRAILQENEEQVATEKTRSLKMNKSNASEAEQENILLSEPNELIMQKIREVVGIQLPEPPFTPMIKSISLIVSLIEELSVTGGNNLFHQYAHGIKNLPSQNATLIPPAPFAGELYLGFKNAIPSQSLKILVQVEEGTAEATLDNPDTNWQYLLNNEWLSFEEAFIDDGTKGLIQSGIVSLVIPAGDTTLNTLLPSGLFWLRAAVPADQTRAVCKIIGVHTQAVQAIFENRENDAAYIGTNIPAGTITNLAPKQPAIKKVLQPYPSFGGRNTEAPDHVYTRTSERLRHKSRGITAWDYENIILEAFPEVYKVKVLSHACQYKTNNSNIIAKAGHIIILVVPKTSAQSAIYQPLLSKSKLTAIYEFVRPRCSPFAQLSIINPLFEEVQVTIEAGFLPFVKDRLFYENLLQEDLKRFLSPWAFDDAREPEFGGVIYQSFIMGFVESLSYIDYVIKLELSHAGTSNREKAMASTPASILVSAGQHLVTGLLNTSNNQPSEIKTIAYC